MQFISDKPESSLSRSFWLKKYKVFVINETGGSQLNFGLQESISSSFYAPIFCTKFLRQKLQSWNVDEIDARTYVWDSDFALPYI